MKYKHLDIKFLSDDGVPAQEDAQVALYFDDLPPFAQEAIIDLIASIVETKKNQKRGAHE
jgi:hypothetical protein